MEHYSVSVSYRCTGLFKVGRHAISSELADCYECMGQCGITYVVVLAWTGARAKERQLRIYLCLLCDAALYLLILTLETLYRLLEGSLA